MGIWFCPGDVPVGRVEIVYDDSSKLFYFQTAERKRSSRRKWTGFMEVVGARWRNFEMIIPRDSF